MHRFGPRPADVVGDTPLIYLARASERSGAYIWAKCEFMNPTGSVKDRAARFMVEAALRDGRLAPGGTLVEGTAGNTGIGLALVAAQHDLRCVFVLPETMSADKIDFLRRMGAEVVLSAAVGWDDPGHYSHVVRRIEAERGAVHLDQFGNPANLDAHYRTTGPEIWAQTEGRVDAVVLAAGTGGTISGVGRFLKERDPAVRVLLADPPGSGYAACIEGGPFVGEGRSVLEGVGIGRRPGNFDRSVIDAALRVSDQEALDATWRLLREEGLYVGGSAGLSVAAAERYGRGPGRGQHIVTMLCDTGARYASSLFDPGWLSERGLTPP